MTRKNRILSILCFLMMGMDVCAMDSTPTSQNSDIVGVTDPETNSPTVDSISHSQKKEWVKEGWFVQAGGDLTVQLPYAHKVSQMFQKGSSLGVDVALGRWFTHELAIRGRVSWGNGLIDCKANWLAPMDQPGENHKKGGFISVAGDLMLNLHNTIGGYNPDRVWNAIPFLRAGVAYNFGCDKGTPLIGAGLSNQFRLSDSWGLYFDVAYNGISSGFNMDPSTQTGVGTGSNMYFTFDAGVTYNIGGKKYKLHHAVIDNTFKRKTIWQNWFLQFGADMTLYNTCKHDFKDVFPKGVSMGLDVALGKWFSPQIGFRGKVNFENFLIENKNLEWLPYDEEKDASCYDGGGCIMMYCDALVSAKHVLGYYERGEKWDCYCFGRMGLGRNKSIDSLSPVIGFGIGGSYRLNEHWSIYGDTAYNGITGEFFGDKSVSEQTGAGFNGIWDFNIGVQLNIGNFGW